MPKSHYVIPMKMMKKERDTYEEGSSDSERE